MLAMSTTTTRTMMTSLHGERGFTMIELLVASVTMVIVLGGAVAITSQVQEGYRRQLEDSAAEQEARYALDWIGKYIRAADNNPFSAGPTTPCPAATAPNDIDAIQFDPNIDGEDNDIRLMTDANPPDGMFGGPGGVGGCTQSGEDVTIRMGDPDLGENPDTIVFFDNNTGGAVQTRTDTIIENLEFVFRNAARGVLDTSVADQANVFYIETRITIRTRTINATTGQPETRVLSSEVKVRSRT
jgi:type II secretory pathway pseudopilin PulG